MSLPCLGLKSEFLVRVCTAFRVHRAGACVFAGGSWVAHLFESLGSFLRALPARALSIFREGNSGPSVLTCGSVLNGGDPSTGHPQHDVHNFLKSPCSQIDSQGFQGTY